MNLLILQNHRDDENKMSHMQDLNLLKNHLYNTSVLFLVLIISHTQQIFYLLILLIDSVVDVYHVIVIQIGTLHQRTDNALIP